MSDPNRLLDDPNLGGFGRALLDAAGSDGPDAVGRERVAKRLGIAAGLASSAVAGGSAVATVLTATAIVIGLGAVLGMAVSRSTTPAPTVAIVEPRSSATAASSVVAPSPSITPAIPAPQLPSIAPAVPAPPSVVAPSIAAATTPSPTTTVAPRPPSRATAAPSPTSVPVPAAPSPTVVPAPAAPSPTVVAAPATVTAPPIIDPPAPPTISTDPPPTTVPATPAPIDARRLAAEVASLDRAREQLRRHDAGAALTLLDAHDREFGSGVLIAEAAVVRIEALASQGRGGDVRRLADSFLSRFPRSPLVQRVRSLRDSLR